MADQKHTVKFGDICREVKLSSKDPLAEGYDKYIGLEHLDSGSLKIKRWGSIVEDKPSFTRVFKKGHILFGKRRPYLKKAAIAEFDGICSGDIIVMEPQGDLMLPELLPFIVQSEKFWDWAIKTSSGSLSPRTKFKELSALELMLPSIEEQYNWLSVLNKAMTAVEKNNFALGSLATLRKSILIEFFKKRSKMWQSKLLGELFDVQLGKMLSKNAIAGVNPKPYLANINIQWGRLALDNLKEMDFNEKEMDKFNLIKGDILVCEGGEIGRSAIWRGEVEGCYFQKALHRLRPINNGEILPDFMLIYMEYKFLVSNDFASEGMTTTIAHIPREKLIKLPVFYPDYENQVKIVKTINDIDTIRSRFNTSAKQLADLQKNIIAYG